MSIDVEKTFAALSLSARGCSDRYIDRDVSDDSNSWTDPITGQIIREPIIPHDIRPLPKFAHHWRNIEKQEKLASSSALVTPLGIISLQLRDTIQVDITVDKAVRVLNRKSNILLAIGKSGDSAALMHANGRVYQYGSRVEIVAHDLTHGNNKFAKMWHKGVSFTSEECALVYLVDSAGTRTTTDSFTDMTKDFSLSVFYGNSLYGTDFVARAIEILEDSQYWISEDGTEHWIINNLRITQAADGLLRIARCSNKYQLRTSPVNGTASLTTPFVHTTASLGSTSHIFVRRGERRMHFDGSSFIVRNAGHSAGFDEKNQLKVY